MELTIREWLAERDENCQRIAKTMKPGVERDGWIEDAGFYRTAYELINDTALMLRGMTLDPRIPRDTKAAVLSRVQELES